MPSYLVVANQTLGGEQLIEEIRRRISARPNTFFILVPATPPVDVQAGARAQILFSEGLALPRDLEAREDEAEHRALLTSQSRLEQLISWIRAEGQEAKGEIGDEDPLKAIGDLLARGETFDGIIISTLPSGVSRWLRMDLPHKVERRYKLPVTTVTAKRTR